MPIKGLTDTRPSFPCIGKLRKGSKKQGNKPGEDLDYFRFDSQDEGAIAKFEAKYGDKPTEINVLLPHPTVEENFFTCKEEWGAGGLKYRCDGEFCMVVQLDDGRYQRNFASPMPCPGGCNCKEVGRLQIVIPELERFAYVTVETHSLNDIVNLHQQLTAVDQTFGHLNKLPFTLRRRPEQISTPSGKDGKRVRREKWMLSIELDSQWAARQFEATRYALEQRANVYHAELKQGHEPLALPVSTIEVDHQPVVEVEPITLPQNDVWLKFQKAIARAETEEQINHYEDLIHQRIREGLVPNPSAAHDAVAQEVAIARERIKHRGYSQLPKYLNAIAQLQDPLDADTLRHEALADLTDEELTQFNQALDARMSELSQQVDMELAES